MHCAWCQHAAGLRVGAHGFWRREYALAGGGARARCGVYGAKGHCTCGVGQRAGCAMRLNLDQPVDRHLATEFWARGQYDVRCVGICWGCRTRGCMHVHECLTANIAGTSVVWPMCLGVSGSCKAACGPFSQPWPSARCCSPAIYRDQKIGHAIQFRRGARNEQRRGVYWYFVCWENLSIRCWRVWMLPTMDPGQCIPTG